jgi:sporulation-control protein
VAVSRFLKMVANGVNPPKVTCDLDRSQVRPGERLTARLVLEGGAADVVIRRFAVELVVRFESHGQGGREEVRFLRTVGVREFPAPFGLAAGEKREEEAVFELPWEMPLTHTGGRRLKGAYSAVRTELAIDDAVDRGDLDEVQVHALPAQEAVLAAMTDIGFRHQEAEVKPGRSRGARHAVDWWQEIEVEFPAWKQGGRDLELILVTREDEIDVHPGSYVEKLTLRFGETADRAALAARLDAHMRAQFGG